jgi:hypothetical protein
VRMAIFSLVKVSLQPCLPTSLLYRLIWTGYTQASFQQFAAGQRSRLSLLFDTVSIV